MDLYKQLELDFYKKDKFWELSSDERFEYYKNFLIAALGLLEANPSEKKSKPINEVLSQLALLIIFLTTTDEERDNEIELKWLDKFNKELNISFFTEEGEA